MTSTSYRQRKRAGLVTPASTMSALMMANRDPNLFALTKEADVEEPACAHCGHSRKAHTEGVGCLHQHCYIKGAKRNHSDCPGYEPGTDVNHQQEAA